MREIFKLSAYEKKIIIIMLFILLVTIPIRFIFDLNPFSGLIFSILSLLSVSTLLATIIAKSIIEYVRKRIKNQSVRRGGKDYRPLEFIFFISIFIATVFLTYAMAYFDYQSGEDVMNYILYWITTLSFYIFSVEIGIAHYIQGIHGRIKR